MRRWLTTTATRTDEDTPKVVAAADGVLDGDSDVDGDALTAVWSPVPSHGTLTLNANGSFSLHPGRELQRTGLVHLRGW